MTTSVESTGRSATRVASGWRQSKKARFRITLFFKYLIAALVVFFSLFPILWTISASLNPTSSVSGQALIPNPATIEHYQRILEEPFWLWMWNSFYIAAISASLVGLITLMTAYAFSRYRWAGRSQLLLTILLIQVFPAILAMVALFALLQQIGNYFPQFGLNTHGGLILIYMGGAMGINVWLMKGFFDSVPRDIDESGKVDGASDWQIFWQLLFPLVRPILVVSMILTFFGTYSDYLMPRIMITSADKYTLMLGLYNFIGDNYSQDWGPFAAGAVIGAIPMVVVYLLLQDYIVGGLTAGSVKG